jgi:predicted RNase H-like nuclease (RuvC/YqgF family)
MSDEYELISVTPLRKLEKRLDVIEKGSPGYNAVLRDLVEMMKENQHVVDSLIKTNSELISNIGELSQRLSGLTGKFGEFMDSIEVAGTSEEPQEWSNIKKEAHQMADLNKELEDRIKKLERQMKLSSLSRYYYQSGQGQQRPPQQAQAAPAGQY